MAALAKILLIAAAVMVLFIGRRQTVATAAP
jgi:hypothetical protein